MKGCYVYFINKDTERFFKSRKEILTIPEETQVADRFGKVIPFRQKIVDDVEEAKRFHEYLPVYSLKAAAGNFGDGIVVQESGWLKVDIGKKLNRRMFVSNVVGHSMEPLIPDNSYCLFRIGVEGTRNNKIVLVQHNDISDPDTGGKYTIKKYTSIKKYNEDGTWEHEEIILHPLNNSYKPIIISNPEVGEFNVIAEFIQVL